MDKKKNKILIGCLALLLVMTVGYALFSENITINGTATAKGDFDITATCQAGIIQGLESAAAIEINNNGGTYTIENGYENDSCSVNGNTFSYSSNLKWPGAAIYFTLKITNNGTINAVFNNSESDVIDYKYCLDDNEDDVITEDECKDKSYDESHSATIVDLITNSYLQGPYIYGVETPSGEVIGFDDPDAENKASSALDLAKDYMAIKPGASMYILYPISWDSRYGENVNHMKDFYATFERKSKFVFTQPTS